MFTKKIFMTVFTLCFLLLTANAQSGGWSTPVPIDSTRDIGRPIMAVSPKGQIAVIGGGSRLAPCPLYISDDNGKSFQLRYQFKPPTPFYEIWYPNGIAYDSNNVLWVYWAWDECSDNDCTFSRGRWLYLSRSTDGGKTFDHVLKMKRGFQMGVRYEHEQWMAIGKDNTIHFLRDTAWYNSNKMFTEFNLIYTKLPQGDWTKRQDVYLPLIPDSVELDGFSFSLPTDEHPAIAIRTHLRNNTLYKILQYSKFSESQFTPYMFVDSIQVLGSLGFRLVAGKKNDIYLNYGMTRYEGEVGTTIFTKYSFNNGDTLSVPYKTGTTTTLLTVSDSSSFYGFAFSLSVNGIILYKVNDFFSTPIDSAFWPAYQYGFLTFDNSGGGYIILYIGKSYFIGKDIITSVKQDLGSEKVKNEVQLSLSPNPFNNSTILSFILPQPGKVNITIYDINGRVVQETQNYAASSGENKIAFEANKLASGVYVVSLRYKETTYTAKAMLVK